MSDDKEIIEHQPTGMVSQEITPSQMIQAAIVQGNVPIEQMQALMDMQERWEKNEARKAYNRAVAAFKADPPQIIKDQTVEYKQTKYKHASLDHIVASITPALHNHGLSHRWDIEQSDGIIKVTCVLSHEGGHCEKVPMSGPPDNSGSKNCIQQAGSTVTYLQRYTLMAILGLAASDDDDGGQPAPADVETITDDQALELEARAADYDLTEKFLDWIESKTGDRHIASIPARSYASACKALDKAIAAHQTND